MLGFSYRIPQGWVLKSEGVVQPAIERYRAKEDFGRPRIGRSEHILMDSCSRTLFSAWAKAPDANGEISYDDFGEVTVSAIALSCFPTMEFPKQGSDPETFKDFVGQFALTHPIVEDMGKGKVFSEDGIVFIYLHGTVAFQIPNDDLSRRLSLAMAMTERRGYLLLWFFAAPHDAELLGLTNERAIFDSTPAVSVASAAKPPENKSAAAGDSASFNATETLQTAAPANTPAPSSSDTSPAAASGDQSGNAPGSSASNQQQSAPASSDTDHPSLLRPGETDADASKAKAWSSSRNNNQPFTLFHPRIFPGTLFQSKQFFRHPLSIKEVVITRRFSGRRGICCFPAQAEKQISRLRW